MNEQLFTIIQMTYSTVLTGFATVLGIWIKKQMSKITVEKKADMLLLRYTLIQMHDIYVVKGYITRSALQTFEEIWELYHTGYGGNLLTDRFHDEVTKLKIVMD